MAKKLFNIQKPKKNKKNEDTKILIPSRTIRKNIKNTNSNNKDFIVDGKIKEEKDTDIPFKEMLKEAISYIKNFTKINEMNVKTENEENFEEENNFDFGVEEEKEIEESFEREEGKSIELVLGKEKSSLFKEISGNSKREASRYFYKLLVEIGKGNVEVKQEEAFGDVDILPVKIE